jgi:hypothetical protein
MSEGMRTMTANIMTHDFSYARDARIGGIAGLAVRVGRALEGWGRRAAEEPTREQLQHRIAIEREAREAIAARGDAHNGMYRLLR